MAVDSWDLGSENTMIAVLTMPSTVTWPGEKLPDCAIQCSVSRQKAEVHRGKWMPS
jgi:hypothetical protein